MHYSIKKRLKALIPILLLTAMIVVAITASPAMIFAAEHEGEEMEGEEMEGIGAAMLLLAGLGIGLITIRKRAYQHNK